MASGRIVAEPTGPHGAACNARVTAGTVRVTSGLAADQRAQSIAGRRLVVRAASRTEARILVDTHPVFARASTVLACRVTAETTVQFGNLHAHAVYTNALSRTVGINPTDALALRRPSVAVRITGQTDSLQSAV